MTGAIVTGRPARGARRGATLPLVCVMLTAILGAAALAVDIGRLYYTATELQAAADASALAAASASQLTPNNDSQNGPYLAQQIGALNRAAGQSVNVATADVVPLLYDPGARSSTLSSYFGTVNAVQVTTRARTNYILAGALRLTAPTVARAGTAWIANVNGAACVRPVSLPYTRVYEDVNGLTKKPYSSTSTYAPTFDQAQIVALAPASTRPPVARTFVLIPPWEAESDWDGKGEPNSGSWHTVNYGNNGWPAFRTYLGADVGSAACAAAITQVGTYLYPFTWTAPNLSKNSSGDVGTNLPHINDGFVVLCNRAGNASDATCRDAKGNVGVRVRVPMSDSIPSPNGKSFTQRVRMVTQVRIMCYFRGSYTVSNNTAYDVSPDVCPATQIKDGTTMTTWRMPSAYAGGPPVASGYPSGTVVVLLEGPVSPDLTPDVVLGDTLSMSQRLILVK